MLSSRHLSDHQLKHQLGQSLRKQRELSNRIQVLVFEKEKKIKVIERRMAEQHDQQEMHFKKTLQREQFEQSFQQTKRQQQHNNQVHREVRKGMVSSIHHKQSELQETRQQWYKEMKKIQRTNHRKIISNKQHDLSVKKQQSKQIKLMKINSKENIKKYWDEKVDHLHGIKAKDQAQRYRVFEDSLNNISILQQKEQQLTQELKKTAFFSDKIKTQHNNSILEERLSMTWRGNSKVQE